MYLYATLDLCLAYYQHINKAECINIRSMFQDLLDVADSLNKGVSSVSESEISSSPSLATVHEGLKLCESQLLQVVSLFMFMHC